MLTCAAISALALVGCSSSDDDAATPTTEAKASQNVDNSQGAGDSGSTGSPDPTAVSTCLTDAGFFEVRDQVDGDRPYTDDELDFFDLETELLFTTADGATGNISFYRTAATADEQEATFTDSEVGYTVGRTGRVVYTALQGDGEAAISTIDGCLAG